MAFSLLIVAYILLTVLWMMSLAVTAFPVLSHPPRTFQSAESLQKLVRQSKHRKVGSLKHVSGWRHWSQLVIDTMRFHLADNLLNPVDRDSFEQLWFELGQAADQGNMPSFGNAGSRSGYALDFFCRSRMLADILVDLDENPTVSFANFTSPIQHSCTVMSIGGGPGFDHVGASLVASFYNSYQDNPVSVRTTVFDYEEGWHDLVTSMITAESLTLPDEPHSMHWGGKCDITKPMSDLSNISCMQHVATTDLFVCQYCVAENANHLQKSDFCFFRNLFEASKENSLFLLTETTPRLWPAFVDLAQNCSNLEVSFVRNLGRGKSGPHLLVRKTIDAVGLNEFQQQQYEQYQELGRLHERKLANNWSRQERKVRGTK